MTVKTTPRATAGEAAKTCIRSGGPGEHHRVATAGPDTSRPARSDLSEASMYWWNASAESSYIFLRWRRASALRRRWSRSGIGTSFTIRAAYHMDHNCQPMFF